MKILILSDNFPPKRFDSADTVAFRLANGFQKLGHDVFIITSVQDKLQEEETVYVGLKVFKIYANFHERWTAYLSLYNPQTVDKIKQIINKIKPDIVHAHNIHYYLSFHCLKTAKQSGAKVFLTAHDVMLFNFGKLMGGENYKISAWQQFKTYKLRYNPLRNMIIGHYLKYIDKIFAVSRALKMALNDNNIQNVEVIYNGIEVNDWAVKDDSVLEFKNRFNLQNKKIILFGGRLSGIKGGGVIVEAIKKIIKEIPNATLLMVGKKDNQTTGIIELAKKLDIEKKIVFTGWISGEELRAAFWASEVVVVPSICFDSFPTVNLEAMACKKPVVGTCFGGTSEIVQDSKTGYIINPFNIEFLAEKIVDLLNSAQKARKFGETGYELVKNNFSLNAQINQTLLWYKKSNSSCYF